MNDLQLQTALRTIGLYKGALDGKLGPASQAAINDFLGVNRIGYHPWGQDRRALAAKQLVAKQAGLEVGIVDGLLGPTTRQAFAIYVGRLDHNTTPEVWRDVVTPVAAPPAPLKAGIWPTQAGVRKFYGEINTNQTMIQLPYEMRLTWDRTKPVKRISCHEKVADSMVRVLTRVADAYTPAQRSTLGLDLFSGCLNPRLMRGSKTQWSMHSWGIAIDFDDTRNQLRWGRDRARLAKPDCETFWRLWEEEGWVSLGRARNYDWMHVQAARLG